MNPGQQAGVTSLQAEPGEQDQADHHKEHPERHRAVRSGPRLNPRGQAREHRDAQRHRHERQAGLDRRETQGLLQVQRGEEVDAEDAEGPDHHGAAAAAELTAAEHRQVHHRVGRAEIGVAPHTLTCAYAL